MKSTAAALQRLLNAVCLEQPPTGLDLTGLVHPRRETEGVVLSKMLLGHRAELSNDGEWILALMGLNPQWRQGWLILMAARCKEAGIMSDPQALATLITQLGGAAEWVLPTLSNSQLMASPLAALEYELLGYSLHENSAIPALTRILNHACQLVQQQSTALKYKPLPDLCAIDNRDKAIADNWCAGRPLTLPGERGNAAIMLTQQAQQTDDYQGYLMADPWVFLLALLIHMQDAWSAEHRGGLILELPRGQNAFGPTQLDVLIQNVEGDEILCGTLGAFLLRVLEDCQISLYPRRVDAATLNSQLSHYIGAMLSHKLWQYQEGSGGRTGQYRIHPEFADASYALPLSPLLLRRSKPLQNSMRQAAECWRSERMVKTTSGK